MEMRGRIRSGVVKPLMAEAVEVPSSDYLIRLWDATERELQEGGGTADRRVLGARPLVARRSVERLRPYSYD